MTEDGDIQDLNTGHLLPTESLVASELLGHKSENRSTRHSFQYLCEQSRLLGRSKCFSKVFQSLCLTMGPAL